MTTTATEIPVRLDFDAHAPAFAKAMGHLDHTATKELDRVDFDPRLRELVRVRASQLNGCAYCIDMHTKDARAIGETLVADSHVPAEAYQAVAAEFTPDEVAALLGLIVTINAWNAIAVSTRAWVPGSYQP
jgi:AhpD family alkylhydroperoxidase